MSRTKYRDTYLYFAQAEGDGPIKIGVSVNPLRRLEYLQASSPSRMTLLGVLANRDRFDEAVLHHHFADQRLKGEWFEPVDELLEVAAGRSWPSETAITRLPAASGVPNPNDLRMPMAVWRKREAIQVCADSGMTVEATARMMQWDYGKLEREIAAMSKLGYFRGTKLQRFGDSNQTLASQQNRRF